MEKEIKNLQAYLNAKHSKEEFSSEKLELANQAGDFEKKSQRIYSDIKNIISSGIDDIIQKVFKKEGDLVQLQQEAEQQVKKLERWEKEIGESIKAKKLYESAKKDVEGYLDATSKRLNSLRSAKKS